MSAQLMLDGTAEPVRPALIMTAHYGRNDALIAAAARLYIEDRAAVLDCTYGRGGFWSRTETARFRLVAADLLPGPGRSLRADFRALPFAAASFDIVTLDPPYVHSITQPRHIHDTYRNQETTPGLTYAGIIELYRAGMAEARRVLRPGGLCWVKCQDTVENHAQQWSIIELHAVAAELGYSAQDLFVLMSANVPGGRHAERQYHARRNHSYLWIFSRGATS